MSANDLQFTYEDPPNIRHRTHVDYEAVALITKRAKGRWVKLTDTMHPSRAAQLREQLGAGFEVTARAVRSDDGRKRAHIYLRFAEEDA